MECFWWSTSTFLTGYSSRASCDAIIQNSTFTIKVNNAIPSLFVREHTAVRLSETLVQTVSRFFASKYTDKMVNGARTKRLVTFFFLTKRDFANGPYRSFQTTFQRPLEQGMSRDDCVRELYCFGCGDDIGLASQFILKIEQRHSSGFESTRINLFVSCVVLFYFEI